MKRGKKILIALGVMVALAGAAVLIFHDDADLDQIEEKQQADIDEVVPEKFDELNASFEE